MIQRVLAIPTKRSTRRPMSFLSAEEAAALVDAPDLQRCEGRRDRALLVLAIQAGLRVSELIGLDCADVVLGTGGHDRCEGKAAQRAVSHQLRSESAGPDGRASRPGRRPASRRGQVAGSAPMP